MFCVKIKQQNTNSNTMDKRSTWSDEQVAELIELKAQGMSYMEISKKLNRDYDSVRNKYYRSFVREKKISDKPKQPWTVSDDDFLLRLSKKFPRGLLIKHYNSLAREYGIRPRTPSAINFRLRQLGANIDNGYLTRSTIAAGLGCGEGRVNNWIRDGLKGIRSNGYIYVHQSSLVSFITSNPKTLTLAGVTEFGLEWFLELVGKVRECDHNAKQWGE